MRPSSAAVENGGFRLDEEGGCRGGSLSPNFRSSPQPTGTWRPPLGRSFVFLGLEFLYSGAVCDSHERPSHPTLKRGHWSIRRALENPRFYRDEAGETSGTAREGRCTNSCGLFAILRTSRRRPHTCPEPRPFSTA